MSTEAAAAGRGVSLYNSLLSFLPRALLVPQRPAQAILTGWAMAFLPSVALGIAVSQLLPAVDQPKFNVDGAFAVAMLVIAAPLVETLIMGAVLVVLQRLVPPTAAVLISSAGWGIAHSMVAPAWGLVIWWPFLIFSTLFVTWSRRSLLAAFAMAAAVHGLHNLPSALLLFSVS